MTNSKTILITGASSGIGAATARAAYAAGHNLALGARSVDKLEALEAELGGNDARIFVGPCDVTDEASVEAFVSGAKEALGGVDVLFANAGVGGEPGGLSSAPISCWRKIIDTNIFGLAVSIQKCLPLLKAAKGHVVITGSIAGRRVFKGSMYSISKWAANNIAYGLREELRGTGVRVTLIEPGIVDTPFFDSPKPDGLRPEDVARTVLFAVDSPESVEVHDLLVMPRAPVE